MTAPVAAPQPAPWPVAVSQDVKATAMNKAIAIISKRFFFMMCRMKLFRINFDGDLALRIQAKSKKLARDPPALLNLTQPVLLIENAESIFFHAAQQRVIDRGHNFRGHHGATIFPRK